MGIAGEKVLWKEEIVGAGEQGGNVQEGKGGRIRVSVEE